ncbi:hypothetical protein QCA50_006089 [Cerrena zonata]|uniref:Uncharacterized protein n=1 Tax=Cerrena zonata TaxID=2478898 RepID=A0AAW0GDK6_9APHY
MQHSTSTSYPTAGLHSNSLTQAFDNLNANAGYSYQPRSNSSHQQKRKRITGYESLFDSNNTEHASMKRPRINKKHHSTSRLGQGLPADISEERVDRFRPIRSTQIALVEPAEVSGPPTYNLPPFKELLGDDFHHYPFVGAGVGLGITWEIPAPVGLLPTLSAQCLNF